MDWKPIKDYEGVYEINSTGVVRRIKPAQGTAGGVLKQKMNKNGYFSVRLCSHGVAKTFFIHSLLCRAFHGPRPSKKHEVCHGDGTKTNNSANNLRWGTRKENIADCIKHNQFLLGERHQNAKLTDSDVVRIRALCKESCLTRKEIAQRFKIHPAYVNALARGEWRRHA